MFDKIKIVAGLMTIVSLSQCSIAYAGEGYALNQPSGVTTQAAEGYYTNSANPSDLLAIKPAHLTVDLSVLHFESTLASAILPEKMVTNEAEQDLSTKNNNGYLISRQPNKSVVQNNKNHVGVLITPANGLTLFGINSKLGISDNISFRPFIQFGADTKSSNIQGTTTKTDINTSSIQYGVSATYDFSNPNGDLTPYAGIGFIGGSSSSGVSGGTSSSTSFSSLFIAFGADYNFGNSIVVNADYKIRENAGVFGFGAGYRF